MPPKQQTGLSLENAIFYISLVALAVTVGTFFYLQYATAKSNDELASLTAEAAKSKTEDQKKLEEDVLRVQQELRDFSKLIAAQKASSELFGKLESLTIQGVYFKSCKIEPTSMLTTISGHARNFEILGQQISKMQSSTDILANVTIGNVVINEDGGVDFDVKVQFKGGAAAPSYGG